MERPHATGREGVAPSRAAPAAVSGLCRAGDLARMLPGEALLLSPALPPAARRLFLARLAGRGLLSYELAGWEETRARPRRSRHRPRRPVGPGGPILVCLDTSWSMAGAREALAKAVVLEAVRAAFAQVANTRILAYSHSYTHTYSHILAYTCSHTHTNTHTLTYSHTHTRIHTCSLAKASRPSAFAQVRAARLRAAVARVSAAAPPLHARAE
jgi:hypothetical protein